MYSRIQNQFRLGILVAIFGMVLTCLITNCPRGGKRSEPIRNNDQDTISECISCGPENQGVCLGRNICCGKEIGCLTSRRYSKPCRNLTSIKISCLLGVAASTCGQNGYCRTKYLCCTKGRAPAVSVQIVGEDRCTIDPSCKSSPHIKYKDFNEGLFPGSDPYAQPLLLDRDIVMERSETKSNLDEIQRAKTEFPANGIDYV